MSYSQLSVEKTSVVLARRLGTKNIKRAVTGHIFCSTYFTEIELVLEILGKDYTDILLF